MIKVGLTGGIGCGKSYVADLLRRRHIPVYDTDKEAKRLNLQPFARDWWIGSESGLICRTGH